MNKEMIKRIAAQIMTAWVLVIGLTAAAQAATLTVDNTTDDASLAACTAAANDCSLRGAIATAQSGDEIAFSALFDAPQIINVNGELAIAKTLTVTGKGANLLTIRNTAAASVSSRVFRIDFGTVNLSGMTITGGNTTDIGGGIFVFGGPTTTLTGVHVTGNTAGNSGGIDTNGVVTLNLINSTVSNNTAIDSNGVKGGGIVTYGSLNITNSTVSGNRAPNCVSDCGGGIYKVNAFTIMTVTDSTITDNEATGTNSAGGIYIENGTATVRNSIIAANRNNTITPDVAVGDGFYTPTFASSDYNLIGNRGAVTTFNQPHDQTGTGASPLNPQLSPLGNYGGSTPTHALLGSSPAIDKGNSFDSTADQRGFVRPVDDPASANGSGNLSDIGAFEVQTDSDGDGIADSMDNCPANANANQLDTDGDGMGDVCDDDDDNDGVLDINDAFPLDPTESVDTDSDGIGNNADTDDDNDGQSDADEIACGSNPLSAASKAVDTDGDNRPNCVDPDDDNDGVADTVDNCPLVANPNQADFDQDGIGDTCDAQTGPPRNKDQCKNNNWMRFDFPRRFKNQGDCIQFVNTGR